MGLINAIRRRRSFLNEKARTKAYQKAVDAGFSAEEAAAAGEKAVRRARRRRRAIAFGAGSSGG